MCPTHQHYPTPLRYIAALSEGHIVCWTDTFNKALHLAEGVSPLYPPHPHPPPPSSGVHLGAPIAHLAAPICKKGAGCLRSQGIVAVGVDGALFVLNPYTLESAGPLDVEGITNCGTVLHAFAGVELADGSFYLYLISSSAHSLVKVVKVVPRNLVATLVGDFVLTAEAPSVVHLTESLWVVVAGGKVFSAGNAETDMGLSEAVLKTMKENLAGKRRAVVPLAPLTEVEVAAGDDVFAGLSEGGSALHICVSSGGSKTAEVHSYDVNHRAHLGAPIVFPWESLAPHAKKVSGFAVADGQVFVALHDTVFSAPCSAASSSLCGAILSHKGATVTGSFVSIAFDGTSDLSDLSAWKKQAEKKQKVVKYTKEAQLLNGAAVEVIRGGSRADVAALWDVVVAKKWWSVAAEVFASDAASSLNLTHNLHTALLPALLASGQDAVFKSACNVLSGEVPATVFTQCTALLMKKGVTKEACALADALVNSGLLPEGLELAMEIDDGLTVPVKQRLLEYLYSRLLARFSHPSPATLDAAKVPRSERLCTVLSSFLDGCFDDLIDNVQYAQLLDKISALCDTGHRLIKMDTLSGQLTALVGSNKATNGEIDIDSKQYALLPLRKSLPLQPMYSRRVAL